MVAQNIITASNAKIASTLPSGLVGVFIGGTNGIGEYTLKAFAKHVSKPQVIFTGRSQEAADRIVTECKSINPEGSYTFIKADTSTIRKVDEVSEEIKRKVQTINVLFLTTGVLDFTSETSDGFLLVMALAYYCRLRFMLNLLPLVQSAKSLRRVVTVLAGGKEGPVDVNDFQGRKVGLMKARGHNTAMITLSLQDLAKKTPDVAFIHDYPGFVKSGIAREAKGMIWAILNVISPVMGMLRSDIPSDVCGERHLYLATSARFAPASGDAAVAGVPVAQGDVVAKGSDGKVGSGAYNPDEVCDDAGPKNVELLAGLRKDGVPEKLWEHTQQEYRRVEGLQK